MIHCRNCESTDLALTLDLGMQPWGNDFARRDTPATSNTYPLELYFCQKCNLVQIGHTVPKEIMFVNHSYVSGTTSSLRQHFEMVGRSILQKVAFADGDYILDVGGNDGTFLKFFVDQGIASLNIDPGILQAERSEEACVPCLNTFFNKESAERIFLEHGPAKVIHGSGVFFHLEELHSAFEGVKTLLSPDGRVVIEFIYLPAMVEGGAFDQIYHEHLVYYTLHTLNRLLERHGLALVDAELVKIHGGSCIATATHREQATPSERLTELLSRESDAGYETITPYLNFAQRAEEIRAAVLRFVNDMHKQKKTIQALGAPVKGCTIMHFCGLTEKEIERAVEVNPLKCGTWFPGTRIPVDHQDTVAKPDAYLMLSWNFRDEILSKMSEFFDAGGLVFVPIPEPTLIGSNRSK
ncbi:class I SAM-dependent methyltransferase [Nisaea sp.]|uniref:class I SAM-dependent methyltransferase n=1 Tax=Nisaea sp. TaxID=2024842 RepID=UPI0032EE8AF5